MDHVSDSATLRVAVIVLVSFVAFLLLLEPILARRPARPGLVSLLWVSAVVVVAGMACAKVAANSSLPPWVCYGLPAVATLLLPPMLSASRRQSEDVASRPARGCTRRGTELKIYGDHPSIINVRPAGIENVVWAMGE